MLFSAYAGLISRKLSIAKKAECMSLCMYHLDFSCLSYEQQSDGNRTDNVQKFRCDLLLFIRQDDARHIDNLLCDV